MKYIVTFVILILSLPSLAVDVEGYIIEKNSEKVDGILRINSDSPNKYTFGNQTRVLFAPMEVYKSKETLKGKDWEKYKPGKINGYGFDSFEYKSVKYRDSSAVGTNMLRSQYFVLTEAKGKINLYRFYSEDSGCIDEVQCGDTVKPIFLMQKGDGKVRSVEHADLQDYFKDCNMVMDKWKSGGYGIEFTNREDKKGFMKFVDDVVDANSVSMSSVEEMIRDYNTACN